MASTVTPTKPDLLQTLPSDAARQSNGGSPTGVVPDPLQTLEPTQTPTGPALKNEGSFPRCLILGQLVDPWAALALYEAPNVASNFPGSKVWLVSVRAKAKLQQVLMTIAQRVNFEFVSGRCQRQRPCRCARYGQRPGRNDSESCRAGPLARGSTLPCRRRKSDSRARYLPIHERCGRSSAPSEWMCRRACDIARSRRRHISGYPLVRSPAH
jgi:hypothetical protein